MHAVYPAPSVVVVVPSGKRAKLILPLCFGALMLILMVSGFITECAGLSHTRRNPEMGSACPFNYWNAAAGVLSVRAILWVVFAIGAAVYWSGGLNPVPMASCFVFLCLPLTLSNTALTAQAWEAVNCTQAMMEGNRDADPLIAAGSSMLMMVDWIMLLLGLGWAVSSCCAQGCYDSDSDGCCAQADDSESDGCCAQGCCADHSESDECCTEDCCGVCMPFLGKCAVSIFMLCAFGIFVSGLVYAHGKTECPSAFWPFAISMFFLIPCCFNGLCLMVCEADDGKFKEQATVGWCCLISGLCFAFAAIVMAALQSDDCKSATGPLLAAGMVMYAIMGLCVSIACVGRCVALFCRGGS
jgi:hypothetical protein